jgi:hypothetical protein
VEFDDMYEYAILNLKLTLCVNGRTDWDIIRFTRGTDRKQYIIERWQGMEKMKKSYCLVNKEVPKALFKSIRDLYFDRSRFYYDDTRRQPRSTSHPGNFDEEHETSEDSVRADLAKWTLHRGHKNSASIATAPVNSDLETRAIRAAKRRKIAKEEEQLVVDEQLAKKLQMKDQRAAEAKKVVEAKKKFQGKRGKAANALPPRPKPSKTCRQVPVRGSTRSPSQSQMTPSPGQMTPSPGQMAPSSASPVTPLELQYSLQLQHNAAMHAQKVEQDNLDFRIRMDREEQLRQVYKADQCENNKRKRDDEDREDMRRALKQDEDRLTLVKAAAETKRQIEALRQTENLATEQQVRHYELQLNHNQRVRDAGLRESELDSDHRRNREIASDRRKR